MRAAVKAGDAKKLAELIRQDPGFNVNEVNENGATLLHHACRDGIESVAPILLAHPDIDVNLKSSAVVGGNTPFILACAYGHTSCVRLLLKDSRVKVNEPQKDGYTPLWCAAYNGHLDVIKRWIASGREMDLGTAGYTVTDAIGVAKKNGKTEVATLLERFKSDTSKTRSEVRKELGITGKSTCSPFPPVSFQFNFSLILKSLFRI